MHGGRLEGPRPTPMNGGTIAEVRDLFFATPARLKFMKTDRAEASAISDVVKRVAIAFPHIRFSIAGSDRTPLDLAATGEGSAGMLERISQVLGKEFPENAIAIDAMRDGVRLIRLCRHSCIQSRQQPAPICLCERPARPRQADLGCYTRRLCRCDFARPASGRRAFPQSRSGSWSTSMCIRPKPMCASAIPGWCGGLIVGAIREALGQSGIRAATSGAEAMLNSFRLGGMEPNPTSSTGQRWQGASSGQSELPCPAIALSPVRDGASRTAQRRWFCRNGSGIPLRWRRRRLPQTHAPGRLRLAQELLSSAARRGTSADSRQLHRLADRRQSGHCRPARGP